MKKVFVILMAVSLTACTPNENIDIDDSEVSKESQFIEDNKTIEEVITNTEKKPLDKMETEDINPEPNEKPEDLDKESASITPADVEKITVKPLDKNSNNKTETDQDDKDSKTLKTPKYKVNNPEYSGILNDVYLLESNQELYEIEQENNINITIINTPTSGQRVLIIPRMYHGMLRINEISYDSEKDIYNVGKEYLNVYMADQDAILLETELNSEKPNILLTYSDEEGNYLAQTFLRYSEEDNKLTVDSGYNASNY